MGEIRCGTENSQKLQFSRTDVGFDQFWGDNILAHKRTRNSTTHEFISNEVLDQGEDITSQVRKRDKALS